MSSARWHKALRPVVYCAPNPATALLEILVHIEIDLDELPEPLQYLEIEVPDTTSAETFQPDAVGPHWQTDVQATQTAGDEWLKSGRTALLSVPSAIVPATWNVLINPQHRDSACIRVARVHEQAIDPRLL